jgi:hypothetical protein
MHTVSVRSLNFWGHRRNKPIIYGAFDECCADALASASRMSTAKGNHLSKSVQVILIFLILFRS